MFVWIRVYEINQEKVIEEQKQVEAEFGDSYSADAVTKMVYLDACLRETVRQVRLLLLGFFFFFFLLLTHTTNRLLLLA